jgi:hypothetical protein
MTSRNQTVSFHTQSLGLGVGGGVACASGLLAFLSTSVKGRDLRWVWVACVLGLSGLAMIVASLVIHESLKEEVGTDIGTIVSQLQRQETLSQSVNEPAILTGIGLSLIHI